MNRKDRRAASKQGKGFGVGAPSASFGGPSGPSGARSSAAMLLATAARHFAAGQRGEAERLCRQLTQIEPNHAPAWHMLGVLACQSGHPDVGVEHLKRSLTINRRSADCQFSLAHALLTLRRLDDAALHFAEVARLNPDFAPAYLGLGEVLLQQGRLDEAQANCERALALDPRAVPTHYCLANVALQQGRLAEAAAGYRRVLTLKPDFAEACSNLAVVLGGQGEVNEAIALYRHALALKPGLIETYRNLGRLLLTRDAVMEALSVVRAGLDVGETEEVRALFVQCARRMELSAVTQDVRALIARALAEGWGRPSHLSGVVAQLVKQGRAGVALAACQCDGDAASRVAREPNVTNVNLVPTPVADDHLLHALLKAAPVADIELEHALTMLRRALLARAAGSENAVNLVGGELEFIGALSEQCFINEYVFAVTDAELAQARQLQSRLESALESGDRIASLSLLALAAYVPLHTLAHAEVLLQRRWDEPVARVIEQQVREPLHERELRAIIPVLTLIDDIVSQKVRDQYEEMPYPRWIIPAPVGGPTTIDWYLRNQFPLAAFHPLGKRDGLDILIAGCGTGQHSIETARRFPDASVLAVDLSLSSLSYAKRKTHALGLGNIEYAQADLLSLGTLARTFDVIESIGVLHHLGDWAEGWRVLLTLLKPGGVMNIGLYSAIAREDFRDVRALIAERGYDRSAADIRCCRQELMQSKDGTPLKNVTRYPDFFSMSDCRDLLFHVQEHPLTIPEIKTLLADHGLIFLGFVDAPQAYRTRFPNDPAMTDLDQWHTFETENPLTFVAMYQFWIQKPLTNV
jgi:tetratricopeptide (TPR) repeat protein/SAM-dependent methyltransferase